LIIRVYPLVDEILTLHFAYLVIFSVPHCRVLRSVIERLVKS